VARVFARVVRVLLGDRPRLVLCFVSPTLLAVAMDLLLRPRSLLAFTPLQYLNYFGSSLASAGFWGGPLWMVSGLFLSQKRSARIVLGAFFVLLVLPLATFCFGGQLLYFHVFHAYMARDTVRLGIALRGTLGAWLASWGGSVALMAVVGVLATAGVAWLVRRASKPVRSALPILPLMGFGAASYCFWVDFVESRSLQAAPPDTCFIHGVVHAIHDGVTGKGWVRRGVSLREPAPLPPLAQPAHRPNVILVVSESVRADAFCSAPAQCKARFLDEVAGDRIALGRLTSQSSGTFTSCAVLWSGIAPDADFATFHHVPLLWEVARAVGYRTAYIGAQNLRYEDLAAYLENAGIDVLASAADLGGAGDPHLGAPDENATARMLQFVRDVPAGTPYFGVLHLSNTHWPYRVDPALQPFEPHDESPLADIQKLHNHYRNSVLLQERTVSAFVRDLRALPGWDDTAVVFLSDHGEEFREHGGLYHLSTLFEEQVRVPGWLVAGPQAIDAGQRSALSSWGARRTFSQDVNATLLDLLGVLDQRSRFPYAERLTGRSLLRPPTGELWPALMSTASGVWEPDDAKYGVMIDDVLAVRSAGNHAWQCYDTNRDFGEYSTSWTVPACPIAVALGQRAFANAD
jgi:glucan phosphoethanolaminetransferase (alkaline phosphatase superfamily)